MARRFATGLLAVLIGCAAFGAVPGGAADEIGGVCDPDSGLASSGMAVQLSRLTPPVALKTVSPGVVTSWKVQSAPFLEPRTMVLKVIRQVGAEYEVVAESAPGLVAEKPHQFPTRIPVGAGVSFGVTSSKSFPACTVSAGNTVGIFGDVPIGGKAKPFETRTERLLSLAAVVEPDADGDGYGDETQDQCPQSALVHTGACPVPPSAASVKVTKTRLEGNTVAVFLSSNGDATATLTGSIQGKRVAGPVTAAVPAGQVGRGYLQLPKKVRKRLAKLPRKRHLNLVVDIQVDSAGGHSTLSFERSLPGRKKVPPHPHR